MTDKELLRYSKLAIARATKETLPQELHDFIRKIGRAEARLWIKKNRRQLEQLVLTETLARVKQEAERSIRRAVKELSVSW